LNGCHGSGDMVETMSARVLTGLGLLLSDADDQDDSLIARVRRGDVAAVGRLYERYHHHVRAFARRLTGDAASAEDLVHDVFVALPAAAANYRAEAPISVFLVSIAVNRSRTHLRSSMRRRHTLDRFELEPRPPSTGPDHALERRELAHALTRALDSLPDEQRLAFVLCEVEERTSVEAAAILAVPEGTVRTRLFHARRKLREHFAREEA
jgi:RNA polymerase sigma-70 factor (ECF subfamily)